MCDLDVIGSPSRLMLVRKTATLVRVLSSLTVLVLFHCFLIESIKRDLKMRPIYEGLLFMRVGVVPEICLL